MRDGENRSAMAKVKREQRRMERQMECKFEALEAKDQWRDLERKLLIDRIEEEKRAQRRIERHVEDLTRAVKKKSSWRRALREWTEGFLF